MGLKAPLEVPFQQNWSYRQSLSSYHSARQIHCQHNIRLSRSIDYLEMNIEIINSNCKCKIFMPHKLDTSFVFKKCIEVLDFTSNTQKIDQLISQKCVLILWTNSSLTKLLVYKNR